LSYPLLNPHTCDPAEFAFATTDELKPVKK